jgi:uncharacterized protein YndB with AHSA1/START domain
MRKHEMTIEIAAPPEQVWEALSTGQGISSWFTESKVEPGAGGKIKMNWGEGMESTSRIEIWEPGKHLRVVSDRPEPALPSVVDYLLEGRGGKTVLRLVHSGFGATADFDSEYDATGAGWPLFMQMLKQSAERGIDVCRNVTINRFLKEPAESAWKKLQPRVAAEFEHGVTRCDGHPGHWCVEFPEQGGKMTSVFCVSCGGATAVTIMALLYGVSAAEEESVRGHWSGILDQVFTPAAS